MKLCIPGKVHFPHLIWVPSFRCDLSCPNCYLQGQGLEQLQPITPKTLLSQIGDKLLVDQLTISLDGNPSEAGIEAIEETINRLSTISTQGFTSIEKTQLYLTFKSVTHAKRWDVLKKSTKIHVVFSTPPDYEFLKSLQREERLVGLNYLATKKPPQISGALLQQLDFIHLLLEKPPLGGTVDPDAISNWFGARASLLNQGLPINKLSQDRCLECAVNILSGSATRCHAGIHTATVWPNGSVTGCPYDSRRKLEPAINLGANITTALMALEQSPFNNPSAICTIPQALNTYWNK